MNCRTATRNRSPQTDGGFTLLEVLIAILIGMIGLMGTVAIQQTVLNSTQSANDAQIAMRLAQQTAEELQVRVTIPGAAGPPNDLLAPIADGVPHAFIDGSGGASTFLNVQGVPSATQTPQNRFQRSITVTNLGANLPYLIVVVVRYSLQTGQPRQIQLDIERRKNW
jgi:prepilin-type N-terminal cleavage/methylation domain-containing protein